MRHTKQRLFACCGLGRWGKETYGNHGSKAAGGAVVEVLGAALSGGCCNQPWKTHAVGTRLNTACVPSAAELSIGGAVKGLSSDPVT